MAPLTTAVVAIVAAAVLAGGLAPFIARVAQRYGIVSPPRPDRWGSRPTPLLGGLAIAVGVITPALLLEPPGRLFGLVVLGSVASFGLGAIDDLRGLRPISKLVGQVVIASGLSIAGLRVELLSYPPADFVLTVLWVVAMMNAVNLIDNMDGLAAGVVAIASGVILLLAPASMTWVAVVAGTTVGACLGFLVHNWSPARIYMGDAGSLLLGFLLATLALPLTAGAPNVGLAVVGPLLALGLPIYDTILVTFMRRLEGRPVSHGGRDHTSHRLAALGLSERATVVVLYGVALVLAVLGLTARALGFLLLPLTALVVVSLILFGVFLSEAPTDQHAVGPDRARRRVLGAGRTLLRFGGEIGLDLVLATTALASAFLIRYETIPPADWMSLFVQAAPIVIPIQIAALLLLDVYRTLWRYVGVADLIAIIRATTVGSVIAGLLMFFALGMVTQSRAVLLLDAILLMALLAGSRFSLLWLRHWFALRPRTGDRRVLIVGADDAGEIALRLLLRSPNTAYHPTGFLDDDPGKLRRRIAGVPVLGRLSDLDTVARRERADLLVVPSDTDPESRDRLRADCAALGIEMREFERWL